MAKPIPIIPDRKMECASCWHYHEVNDDDGQGWGICRRYPKQWYWDGQDAMCDYPQHLPDDVCGEWQSKS